MSSFIQGAILGLIAFPFALVILRLLLLGIGRFLSILEPYGAHTHDGSSGVTLGPEQQECAAWWVR
jgi:hypothetical protein